MIKYNEAWREIELAVQKTVPFKDTTFRLDGDWKKFLRYDTNFEVYQVDVYWVRNNLNVNFCHGGHGYVYEFIPLHEIWISNVHSECICKNVKEGQSLSQKYIDSTILHEITEFFEMQNGFEYFEAHKVALQKEIDIKYLNDPYTEI